MSDYIYKCFHCGAVAQYHGNWEEEGEERNYLFQEKVCYSCADHITDTSVQAQFIKLYSER